MSGVSAKGAFMAAVHEPKEPSVMIFHPTDANLVITGPRCFKPVMAATSVVMTSP